MIGRYLVGIVMTLTTALLVASAPRPATAALSNQIVEDATSAGCSPDYPFKEDNLRMMIRDGRNVVHQLDFCSSYGRADARIENDAKGNQYVILRYGEGRGTNARSEYLKIYRISKELFEFIRIPLSGPAGPTSRWSYDYDLERPKGGGLTFKMHLQLEGARPAHFPSDKTRTFHISQ